MASPFTNTTLTLMPECSKQHKWECQFANLADIYIACCMAVWQVCVLQYVSLKQFFCWLGRDFEVFYGEFKKCFFLPISLWFLSNCYIKNIHVGMFLVLKGHLCWHTKDVKKHDYIIHILTDNVHQTGTNSIQIFCSKSTLTHIRINILLQWAVLPLYISK